MHLGFNSSNRTLRSTIQIMPIILSLKTLTSIKIVTNVNNTENYSTASSGAFCTRANTPNVVDAKGLRSASKGVGF